MFWYNYWLGRPWQLHSTQTCGYDAIILCNPFEQLVYPMLKVFLLITELLMSSISILFFSCRVENLSIFTTLFYLAHTARHHAWALHITRYNHANFSFTSDNLTLANILEDRSTILLCKVPNFSIPRSLPMSEIYSAFVAVWDLFCFYIASQCKVLHQTGNFPSCIGPMNFWTECQEPLHSSTSQSLDVC